MLAPAHFPDVFFWFLARHRGLTYVEVRGAQHQQESGLAWEGPFSIAEHDIQWLESLATVPPAQPRSCGV